MDSNTSLQPLSDVEIAAVAGGRSHRSGGNSPLVGNINVGINVESIVAIGNLILNDTGNAANNASSAINITDSWLGLL